MPSRSRVKHSTTDPLHSRENIEINVTFVKLPWPPFSTFISDFIGLGFNMITRHYIDYIPKSCRLAKMVSHNVRTHFDRPQDVGTYRINIKFSLKQRLNYTDWLEVKI